MLYQFGRWTFHPHPNPLPEGEGGEGAFPFYLPLSVRERGFPVPQRGAD